MWTLEKQTCVLKTASGSPAGVKPCGTEESRSQQESKRRRYPWWWSMSSCFQNRFCFLWNACAEQVLRRSKSCNLRCSPNIVRVFWVGPTPLFPTPITIALLAPHWPPFDQQDQQQKVFPSSPRKPGILSGMLEDSPVESRRKILLLVSRLQINSMLLVCVSQCAYCTINFRRVKHGETSFLSEIMSLNSQSRHFW